MNRDFWKLFWAPSLVGGMAFGLPAFAQNASVFTLEGDVPAEAIDAARAAAPGVDFEMVSIEIEDGAVTIELAGEDAAGNWVEVDVATSSGFEVDEIETEISLEEVPGVVMAALEEELSGFEPETIERSDRTSGETVYEFEGTTAGGRYMVVEVSGDGAEVNYDRSELS